MTGLADAKEGHEAKQTKSGQPGRPRRLLRNAAVAAPSSPQCPLAICPAGSSNCGARRTSIAVNPARVDGPAQRHCASAGFAPTGRHKSAAPRDRATRVGHAAGAGRAAHWSDCTAGRRRATDRPRASGRDSAGTRSSRRAARATSRSGSSGANAADASAARATGRCGAAGGGAAEAGRPTCAVRPTTAGGSARARSSCIAIRIGRAPEFVPLTQMILGIGRPADGRRGRREG